MHRSILPGILALMIVLLVLPGAVSAAPDPLVTIASGTVSGDLFVDSRSPWATESTQSFTLPASGSNIQWARLFVMTYGLNAASGGHTSTVWLDGNGDGDFDDAGELLATEQCSVAGSTDNEVHTVNDHVNKVYSDYEAWYDVTGLITATNPGVRVKDEQLSGWGWDGRIKAVTLVVAYNDGDYDVVKYIVNHGNHRISPAGAIGSTVFDASSFGSGWTDAKITTVGASSTDASPYTLDGITLTKTSLGTTSYWKFNSFDATAALTAGASNTFSYTSAGSSFKNVLAALAVRYPPAPPAPEFPLAFVPALIAGFAGVVFLVRKKD